MRPAPRAVTDLRAVVTDLDGTIVRPDGTVSAATVTVVAALRAAEVPLIVATARTPAGISVLGPVLAEVSVAVWCNGAIGLVRPGSEVLWQHCTTARQLAGCGSTFRRASSLAASRYASAPVEPGS